MEKNKRTSRNRNNFFEPKKPTRQPFIMKCLSGGGKNLYAIYPDYWKKTWGVKPLLGYVWSQDEYWAKYDAYDKGLMINNGTFSPQPIRVEVTA